MFHYVINEDTCKRDKNEKQPFFHRKVGDKPSDDILLIEPPYIISGKDHIPDDEDDEHWHDRREEGFPPGMKMDAPVKAKYQWGEQGDPH
jgi:hypothetical protein